MVLIRYVISAIISVTSGRGKLSHKSRAFDLQKLLLPGLEFARHVGRIQNPRWSSYLNSHGQQKQPERKGLRQTSVLDH